LKNATPKSGTSASFSRIHFHASLGGSGNVGGSIEPTQEISRLGALIVYLSPTTQAPQPVGKPQTPTPCEHS